MNRPRRVANSTGCRTPSAQSSSTLVVLSVVLVALLMVAACSPEASDPASSVPVPVPVPSSESSSGGADLPETEADAYDAALAGELGADEYGMRRYVMAFLKAGPNRGLEPEEAADLQRLHMANIRTMASAGQLVLAGPFLDDGALRGIYIFNVTTVEEARALTATDPAVEAGSLVMELHPWYGSAALMTVNDTHPKLAKTSI